MPVCFFEGLGGLGNPELSFFGVFGWTWINFFDNFWIFVNFFSEF